MDPGARQLAQAVGDRARVAEPMRSIRMVGVKAKPRGTTQKRYSAVACQAASPVKRLAM